MKITLKQMLALCVGTVQLVLPLACAVGPKYQRPAVDLPNQYRGENSVPLSADELPFGDLPWWEVFRDPVLQKLMETALRNNKDLRIAAARVEQSRGQYHWVRSEQFPQLGFGSGISRSWAQKDQATVPPGNLGTSTAGEVGIDLSYQADLWGQYRRGTEAARAQLFASAEFRNNVLITLLSDVAQAYFDLLALDAQLRITEKTVQSRQSSLYLVRQRLKAGWVSLLDVRQAEAELAVAAREIPAISRDIQLKENQISLLLGANPAPVPRGQKLNQQSMPPKLPLDLPSALLERRPDIRQGEQKLIATNAKIGEAKALFFPQINLASFVGMTVGGGLLDATSAASSITGTLFQFLFDGGKRKGNLEIAKANFEEALIQYQQIIQQALREVSDALISIRQLIKIRKEQEAYVAASVDALRLANVRYEGGVASYLEVLDAERRSYESQLSLTETRRNQLVAVVRLYRALGGGWDPQGREIPPKTEATPVPQSEVSSSPSLFAWPKPEKNDA